MTRSASLAFGSEVNVAAIDIEGIEAVTLADIRNADAMGFKIKLLGVAVATSDGIEQRVHPTLVPKGSPVSDTDGVFNAVVVHSDFAGDLMLEGRGAGSHPTASAVLSGVELKPSFAGLAPGFIGLYQVNVPIPAATPPGLDLPLLLRQSGVDSNTVSLSVQ